MGLNLILLTIVTLSCAITILQTRQDAISNSPRWVQIAVGLLFLMGLLLLFVPTQAGYWSSIAWTILIIVPSLGFRLSDHFFYRGNYAAARRLKAWLRWLHPLYDWPWQNALLTAYEQLNAGQTAEAIQRLQEALAEAEAPPEQEVMLFYMSRDWRGLIAWWESYPMRTRLEQRPDVIRLYLQALGETGNLNALIKEFQHYRTNLEQAPNLIHYGQLYLFAFCGRVEPTMQLLKTILAEKLSPDMRMFWIATAHGAAGNDEMSRALLRPLLRTSKDAIVKGYVEMRLGREVATAQQTLDSYGFANLQKIEAAWRAREQQLSLWH